MYHTLQYHVYMLPEMYALSRKLANNVFCRANTSVYEANVLKQTTDILNAFEINTLSTLLVYILHYTIL